MRRRRGHALRRRYGRAWGSESAITRPARSGKGYDVVVVDTHGIPLRTLARSVPLSLAQTIIRKKHS